MNSSKYHKVYAFMRKVYEFHDVSCKIHSILVRNWSKMKQDEARWCKMKQDEIRWNKMKQDGARWSEMKQDGRR